MAHSGAMFCVPGIMSLSTRYKIMRYAKRKDKSEKCVHPITFRSDIKTVELLKEISKQQKLPASEIMRRSIKAYAENSR